ncbi:MAG: DsbE family thiol:disulfide interchange protein [Pelagibacteraceae bacterium]|nr:DsbE family thiol:disulfide interchange protein [Pelagibacteraceae bacterium]|tara:strand:+ start:5238 stop:5756 length:519 start_codon:yes stop_codon:yes gene_type:complete
MKKIVLSLVLVLILFVIVIFSLGLKTKKIYDTKDIVGKPISEVNIKIFNQDKTFNTSELRKNNFTLINFWASWCAPCKKEHKHLMSLNEKNIKILGVNFKDKKSSADYFLKKLGNPYYLVTSDQDGKSSVFFGVYGIPETILIDKDLKIIKKYIGPIDNNDVKKILKIVGAK